MKKVLLALAAILVGSPHAFAAQQNDADIIAQVTGSEQGITSVVLYTNGNLSVTDDKGVQTIPLNQATLVRLITLASPVAGTETTIVHRFATCKMMPLPSLDTLSVATHFDANSDQFSGDLKVILTSQGCWLPSSTTPTEKYALDDAKSLKDELVTLAIAAHPGE